VSPPLPLPWQRLNILLSRRHTLGLVTMYGRHKDLGRVTEAVREGLESGILLDKVGYPAVPNMAFVQCIHSTY